MLAADRQALTNTFKKQSLDIYHRELDFFTRSSLAVSTASSFIVGFAWTGISDITFADKHSNVVRGFYVTVAITIAISIYVVAMTTMMVIEGNNLALRGPEGSMSNAVEGMRRERVKIFYAFGGSLVSVCACTICYCWAKLTTEFYVSPAIITTIVAVFLVAMANRGKAALQYFELPDASVISGAPELEPTAVNPLSTEIGSTSNSSNRYGGGVGVASPSSGAVLSSNDYGDINPVDESANLTHSVYRISHKFT